jgi:hypothetical protein
VGVTTPGCSIYIYIYSDWREYIVAFCFIPISFGVSSHYFDNAHYACTFKVAPTDYILLFSCSQQRDYWDLLWPQGFFL